MENLIFQDSLLQSILLRFSKVNQFWNREVLGRPKLKIEAELIIGEPSECVKALIQHFWESLCIKK